MNRPAAFLLVLLTIAGCDTLPTLPGASSLVVQAFLYSGEPVRDIRITTTVPVGDTATVGAPVNDAAVALIRNGQRYVLAVAPGDSGYYQYTGADLTVSEGDHFALEIVHLGVTITAETTVPSPPASASISADTVTIATGIGIPGMNPFASPLIVRWPATAGSLHYVTVEAVDTVSAEITGRPRALARFILAPTAADSFAISPVSLRYYGEHRVKVYRVNAEYAALYESRQQDSRDLNEPATNITNGLGVFSAFSSRDLSFRVVPDES